jgi:hypothetical protein
VRIAELRLSFYFSMFERIIMFEKVKVHIGHHKVAYSFGAGVVVTGVTVFIFRSGGSLGELRNTAFLVLRNRQTINNIVITQLERRGHPGNLTRCVETGEVFASQARAADLMGINRGNLVSHLNGRVPVVNGYTFERIGEAV